MLGEVFPGASDGKESACNAGDLGLIPGLGRSPGEGNGNSFQYSCLNGEFHGQRNLAGYSPWVHKESGTTDRLRQQQLAGLVAQLPARGPFRSLGARRIFRLYPGLVIHTGGKLIRDDKQVQRYSDGEIL